MTVYWLGFIGGALVVGAGVYLADANHRAKVAEWIKNLRH